MVKAALIFHIRKALSSVRSVAKILPVARCSSSIERSIVDSHHPWEQSEVLIRGGAPISGAIQWTPSNLATLGTYQDFYPN